MPDPIDCTRDADGRVVALVFESGSPPADSHAPAKPYLVAVDGSANSLRALIHVMDSMLALQSGVVHLVNVQPWLSREAAESELAQRGLAATCEARTLIEDRGLSWRLHVVMGGTPAACILDEAARSGAGGIVIGRRGLNAIEGLLFGSVTWKLLQLAALPVIVVP